MMHNLAQERISAGVANLAHATAALEVTLEYSRARRAFGRAIGSFQHNRFTIASALTEVDVTQAYLDRFIAAHVAGELSAIDAAKAKWRRAEVQNRVIDACVQLSGGYGYME